MTVVLYWMAISHPSQAVRTMLDLKHVDYEVVNVRPLNQRVHLRLAGFPGGTVPAIKLDGRRVQGSREISRALDARWPDSPLFPAEPEPRARVEEAERWGDEQFQPIPRRMFRFGVASDAELRREVVRRQGIPAPNLVAAAMQPVVAYYARTLEADGRRGSEAAVRADLAALPAMLDHVDRLLQDGTLAVDPPNAATLEVLATVRVLDMFEDLHETVAAHACAEPARGLFPKYRAELPRFLPAEWMEPLRSTHPASG
jgi:glutathione S-transferase